MLIPQLTGTYSNNSLEAVDFYKGCGFVEVAPARMLADGKIKGVDNMPFCY